MSEHTKGPWRVGGDGFMATGFDRSKIGSNTPINIVSDGGSDDWSVTTHIAHLSAGGDVKKRVANAQRIVSCVNACEGIEPEMVLNVLQNTLDNLKDYKSFSHGQAQFALQVIHDRIASILANID